VIDKTQIRKIHTLTSVLGISDDLYREILETNFEVNSCKKLTDREAASLIAYMEEKAKNAGLWKDFKQESITLSDRENMASPAQINKIKLLWKEVAYKKNRKFLKTSLRKFLERQFKISDVRFIEKPMVNKIIKAIESVKQRSNSVQKQNKEK